MNDLQILREIDSSNLVVISKQDTIIARLEDVVDNRNMVIDNREAVIRAKDIQLEIIKKKANRDKWIIGGTLGATILTGILTMILIK